MSLKENIQVLGSVTSVKTTAAKDAREPTRGPLEPLLSYFWSTADLTGKQELVANVDTHFKGRNLPSSLDRNECLF